MKKYILFITSIITILVTSFFSLLPLNGFTQADISNMYNTIITPAGFTFSIWSIIYFSWIFLGVYFILKKNHGDISKKNIYLLGISQILSAIWLIPWHFQYIFTSFIIIISILSILYYLSINIKNDKFFNYTVLLYFSWILVATIANFNVLLVYLNLYDYSLIIGIFSIIMGFIFNFYFLKKYKIIIPSLVFIWALFGIMYNQNDFYIFISCFLSLILLFLSILFLN